MLLDNLLANPDSCGITYALSRSHLYHRRGKRIKDIHGAWDRACREAGLSGKIPHDFRRTAVRNMVRTGVIERVAMAITGHKTRDIFDRYDIVSEGDLRQAAHRIDEGIAAHTVTTLVTIPSLAIEERTITH